MQEEGTSTQSEQLVQPEQSSTTLQAETFERPDQRPFGSKAFKNDGNRFQRFGLLAPILGAIAIVGIASISIYLMLSKESAPKINLTTVEFADSKTPRQEMPIPAPAPSLAASSASIPAPVGASPDSKSKLELSSVDLTPPAKSDDEYKGEISALQVKLNVVTKELRASKTLVASLRQQIKIASAQDGDSDEFLALTIVDISLKGVVVSDAKKEYLVEPGSHLPGGATFIGFDPASRMMKTDRGDFLVN